MCKKIYSLICFLIFSFSVNATHLAYMDLTYKCLGGNTYEFTLTLYRDCSSLAAPANMAVSACSPSTGATTTFSLDTIVGTGLPVFPVCSYPLSDCVGGTDEGFQKYLYRGIHTLPSAKPDWTFSVQICCREAFITNITSPIVTGEAIICVLDNLNFPGNSSPTFNDEPVLFACCNQSFSYNQSATDIDGDSLVYSLYHPLDNIPSCTGRDSVNYLAGFTYLQPITSSPPISMNPLTGYLIMYPTVCNEVSLMGVKVEEYRAGLRIGFIERDNLMIVTNQAALEVQQTKEENSISVSPNPFSTVVTLISFNLDAVAKVVDIIGQTVYSALITNNKQELNLSELPKGIYFIKVETLDGICTQKIIKQ